MCGHVGGGEEKAVKVRVPVLFPIKVLAEASATVICNSQNFNSSTSGIIARQVGIDLDGLLSMAVKVRVHPKKGISY